MNNALDRFTTAYAKVMLLSAAVEILTELNHRILTGSEADERDRVLYRAAAEIALAWPLRPAGVTDNFIYDGGCYLLDKKILERIHRDFD